MPVGPPLRIVLQLLVKLRHQGARKPPEGPGRLLQGQKELVACVLGRDRPTVDDSAEQLLSDRHGNAELLLAPERGTVVWDLSADSAMVSSVRVYIQLDRLDTVLLVTVSRRNP